MVDLLCRHRPEPAAVALEAGVVGSLRRQGEEILPGKGPGANFLSPRERHFLRAPGEPHKDVLKLDSIGLRVAGRPGEVELAGPGLEDIGHWRRALEVGDVLQREKGVHVLLDPPGQRGILVDAGLARLPGEDAVGEEEVDHLVVALAVGLRLDAQLGRHALHERFEVGVGDDDVAARHERGLGRGEGGHGERGGGEEGIEGLHGDSYRAKQKARMRGACGPRGKVTLS